MAEGERVEGGDSGEEDNYEEVTEKEDNEEEDFEKEYIFDFEEEENGEVYNKEKQEERRAGRKLRGV